MRFQKNALLSLLVIAIASTGPVSAAETLRRAEVHEGVNQRRPAQDQTVTGRRYVWNYRGRDYTVLLEVRTARYNRYDNKQRIDIPAMVIEGQESLAGLIAELGRLIERRRLRGAAKIDFVLSMVQSLPYTSDSVTTGYNEFRRFAVETLVEGGGDCEDTTILAAAILRGLGEDVALVMTPGHIAIGVAGPFRGTSIEREGKKYFYCETTGGGWTVGRLPPEVRGPFRLEVMGPGRPVVTPPRGPEPPETSDPETEPRQDKTVGHVVVVVFVLALSGAIVAFLLNRLLLPRELSDDEDEDYEEEDEDDEDEGASLLSH